MVLVRLCCSVVLTYFIAATLSWKTEQKSRSLKDEKLMMLCAEL